MKKHNPTIVSVSTRKVDPREAEARNLIMWAKTLPAKAMHQSLAYTLTLANDARDAVQRLISLADINFDVTVPGEGVFDFLRVSSQEGQFCVTYMEYFPEEGDEGEHYSSMCRQYYPHVVDAFRCFQKRIESDRPSQSVRV